MGLTVTQIAYAYGGSNPSLPTLLVNKYCGSSSVDRALAFQAEGRGFEPRLPLSKKRRCQFIDSVFLLLYMIY